MSDILQYGGQAVLEGVMMRSSRFFAIACRKPNGEIIVKDEQVEQSIVGKLKFLNKPFLRGTLALIDAMALGIKALNFSASIQADALSEENATHESEKDDATLAKNKRINDIAIGSVMVFAICFGIVLFIAIPTLLTQLIQARLHIPTHHILPYPEQVSLNVVDGLIRISIFLIYLGLITRMEHVRRVFEYHGAEHKAINTLEAGKDLTLENCLESSRIHPRCGTSFIIVVLLASILVHSLFPRPPMYLMRLALHIALIPVVAGLSYEVIKWSGKRRNSFVSRTFLAPGLWTQRLTTREPDETQVEVALTALQKVIQLQTESDSLTGMVV